MILTQAAAEDLVMHMQSLRALSRGLPAAGGPALPLTSNLTTSDPIQRVQSNQASPPVPGSVAAGLLAGLVINIAGSEGLSAEAGAHCAEVLGQLVEKGLLDLNVHHESTTAVVLLSLTPAMML